MAEIQCPECGHKMESGLKECPECGFLFKKNRKPFIIVSIVIVLVIAIGVGIYGYQKYQYVKEQEYLDAQATLYFNEGLKMLNDGKYEQAINSLEQSLTYRESKEVTDKLELAKYEKEAVEVINAFYSDMEKVIEDVESCHSFEEMQDILIDSSSVIEKFESFPADVDTELTEFITNVKENALYQLYKRDYQTGIALEDISSTSYMVSFFVREYKNLIEDAINSFLTERPEVCNVTE